MAYDPTMLIGFEPWRSRPDRGLLARHLEDHVALHPASGARIVNTMTGLFVRQVSVAGLLAAIDAGARGHDWKMVVMLRTPPTPIPALVRAMPAAQRAPSGLDVRKDHGDARVPTVRAVLGLHACLLRGRTAAMWRAIDAYRLHHSATAAADALDCSIQTVSKHLRRASYRSTSQTHLVLDRLLFPLPDTPSYPSGPIAARHAGSFAPHVSSRPPVLPTAREASWIHPPEGE